MKLFKKILVITLLFVGALKGYSQDKEVITATVEFVVNTNNFVKNQNYERFINELVPYIKDNANDVESITLIGSASPEGNVKHNVHLANIRSERIYSYISEYVPKSKVIVNNDYDLFLSKTGLDESDYTRLRATYIELHFYKPEPEKDTVIDTIYIERRDTVYNKTINNYYIPKEGTHNKPVLSVYNDLLGDLLFRANIGTEVYFNKMSFFIEGSFSNWSLLGRNYNIDIWHVGLKKYFNNQYDKLFIGLYANVGYFDTDLIWDVGKIGVLYGGGISLGYVFNLCPHWKIEPVIRIGLFERICYADYYYIENGNINVLFGNYSNGNLNNLNNNPDTGQNKYIITESKVLTKEFFDNCNKAYYFGPTYVGIFLKRDFCLNKKIRH